MAKLILATDAPGGGPEIFASVQGEGPSAGTPVAFLRLSRCNLACVWCDTPYSWHFDGDNRPHRGGETYGRTANQLTLSAAEIAERIAALGQRRLVVTGGEPLLQATALADVLARLDGVAVEVETNGTVVPPPAVDIHIDQYNVSPKLAHSGNPRDLALRAEALAFFAADPRAVFKFVVSQESDVEEVDAIARGHAVVPGRILLMPEGTDAETVRARADWLVPLCLDRGYRFTDRLHIHLFGDTRAT